MRRRGLPFALFALFLGAMLASGLASAHAQYVTSTPGPSAILPSAPKQVSVTLSEAVEGGTGTIRVTNDTGASFDVPPVMYSSDGKTMSTSLGPGGPGIYTATWTAVSAVDGHFTAGSFSFGVQDKNGNLNGTLPGPSNTGAPVSPLEVALRSIGFLGLAGRSSIPSSIGTHAAAAPVFAAVGVAADAAHFGGIGLWFGGLAGIVSIRSFFRDPEAAPLARIVLGRFSRMAAYAVALVLGGGVVLSLLLVGTWEALLGTAYGWVVLGKIALFAPMVGLGAFNRYRLIPETAEAEAPTEAVRRIVGNVRFETGLGIAVLVLAGLLTAMTPAASVASAAQNGVFAIDMVKDGLRVHFESYPYPTTVGVYTFTILLNYESNGTDFTLARNGTIQFTLWDPPRPPEPKENLSGPHGNHFFITTTDLSCPGIWKIDANFQRLDGFDLRATFYVPIKAAG